MRREKKTQSHPRNSQIDFCFLNGSFFFFLSNTYEAQSLAAVAPPPPPNPPPLPRPAVNLAHITHPLTFTQQFPVCDAFLHRRIHLAVHEYKCDGRAVRSDRGPWLVGWLADVRWASHPPPTPPPFMHQKKTQNDKKKRKRLS